MEEIQEIRSSNRFSKQLASLGLISRKSDAVCFSEPQLENSRTQIDMKTRQEKVWITEGSKLRYTVCPKICYQEKVQVPFSIISQLQGLKLQLDERVKEVVQESIDGVEVKFRRLGETRFYLQRYSKYKSVVEWCDLVGLSTGWAFEWLVEWFEWFEWLIFRFDGLLK